MQEVYFIKLANFPAYNCVILMKTKPKKLSSFEKLLLGLEKPKILQVNAPLRKGSPCPQCGKGKLDYNGLLQLECAVCGFVNGESGGCT